MSKSFSLDRESFQTLLAGAFAARESGMDAGTLSRLIDLQHSIETGDCDADTAMQLVADHAINVADANGVGVAVLKADELVYLAGSGTAASRVGRRVKAVLSMSSPVEGRREILRVENAQADWRIEAGICRQLGATSLLMLPIRGKQVLLGVMEISFNEAHTFQDEEVRAYESMAQLVERAILEDAQFNSRNAVRAGPAMIKQAFGQVTSQAHRRCQSNILSNENIWESAFDERSLFPSAWSWFSNVRRAVATLAITGPLKYAFPNHPLLSGTGIVVVISLVMVSWIAYDHSCVSPKVWNPPTPNLAAESQSKQSPTNHRFQQRTVRSIRKRNLPSCSFRVHVGLNETDYIADDVTVRKFTPASPTQRAQDGYQVKIGDDVTVRYFADKPLNKP